MSKRRFSNTRLWSIEGRHGGMDIMRKMVLTALADANIKDRLVDLGGAPLIQPPEDFGKMIADETTKWQKVVAFAGLKVE